MLVADTRKRCSSAKNSRKGTSKLMQQLISMVGSRRPSTTCASRWPSSSERAQLCVLLDTRFNNKHTQRKHVSRTPSSALRLCPAGVKEVRTRAGRGDGNVQTLLLESIGLFLPPPLCSVSARLDGFVVCSFVCLLLCHPRAVDSNATRS